MICVSATQRRVGLYIIWLCEESKSGAVPAKACYGDVEDCQPSTVYQCCQHIVGRFHHDNYYVINHHKYIINIRRITFDESIFLNLLRLS